jgi:bifunctional DNA-binding transcriptional regulator/antitoxin component of YhaV-PrlF toxin-antitoxin module
VEHIYLFFHPDSFDIKPGDRLRIYNGSDPGIYFLKITSGKDIQRQKFLKE